MKAETIFLHGKSLSDAIKDLTSKGDDLCLAVAYWGKDASKTLGFRADKTQSVKIVCDLRSGACNPKEIQDLMDDRYDVRTLDRLHAKVYLSESSAIITSANASANGLGLEGEELKQEPGHEEAGILVTNRDILQEVRNWFSSLKTEAITPAMLEEAEKLWEQRRKRRPFKSSLTGTNGLIEAFEKDKHVFDDRVFFVVHTSGGGDEEADQQARDMIEGKGCVYTDGRDNKYIDGAFANWSGTEEHLNQYPLGSWVIEIWTPKDYQWKSKKLKVSAFFKFEERQKKYIVENYHDGEIYNLHTQYLEEVEIGSVQFVLKEEDKSCIINGYKRLLTKNDKDTILGLSAVLQEGLESP